MALKVYWVNQDDWTFNGPLSLNLPTDKKLQMSGEPIFNSDESAVYMHYFSTTDSTYSYFIINERRVLTMS